MHERERHRIILSAVQEKPVITIQDLVELTEASEATIRRDIAATQAGDPEKLTVMTIFRMYPWEGEASILKQLPTPADIASYKEFVTGMAKGIGSNRVAIVVQPDGFFAWKAYETWKGKVGKKKALLPARLLAWTSKTFAQQPRTTVYVDMGSEDWARGKVEPVAKFLKLSGVKYARGFSLNVSNFQTTANEVAYGRAVAAQVGKHFVIDTSRNGLGPYGEAWCNPPGRALGPRPTTATGNASTDAFLWIKHPGISDGPCNGGPAAGQWWADYALGLARRSPSR